MFEIFDSDKSLLSEVSENDSAVDTVVLMQLLMMLEVIRRSNVTVSIVVTIILMVALFGKTGTTAKANMNFLATQESKHFYKHTG